MAAILDFCQNGHVVDSNALGTNIRAYIVISNHKTNKNSEIIAD